MKQMKLAAVISVGHGPQALKQAIDAQMLLLDRVSARLDSIRLAAPRLLHYACASAIAEKPDVLVLAGGPRAARRAGQLAYEHGVPILFLPGSRAPEWARQLWGSLSLGDMIVALARGDITPTRLCAGMAGKQIFLGQACLGLLPHLPALREEFRDAETFPEGFNVLTRAVKLARLILHPAFRFRADESGPRRASVLILTAPPFPCPEARSNARAPAFACTAFDHGALGYLGALLRGGLGDDWQGGRTEQFECARLFAEEKPASWILLDGDPQTFDGPVEFRLVPGAIQTFIFNPVQGFPNETGKPQRSRFQSFGVAFEPSRNLPPPSHVASAENRESGYRK